MPTIIDLEAILGAYNKIEEQTENNNLEDSWEFLWNNLMRETDQT